MLGVNASPFDQLALPCEICGHGKSDDVSEPSLKRAATQEPSGSLSPKNRGKLVLLGKGRNHFSGTRRVLVDQNYHASVKTLRS